MDMKEVLEHVRGDLRKRPDSHLSEVFFRIRERGASSIDIRSALYEMLKRDEVITSSGKWRLVAPREPRKASSGRN
jgi:hypothetical protein